MTPEAERYFAKGRECLKDARLYLELVPRVGAREAYLAAYHAAEALVFERTGKIAKTHRGVRTEFLRLTRTERLIERPLLEFLARAYELKAMADYGTGAEAVIPVETAKAAFETARRFLEVVEFLLKAPSSSGEQ